MQTFIVEGVASKNPGVHVNVSRMARWQEWVTTHEVYARGPIPVR